MFNCPKCRAEVTYGARYCAHCGCEMNWDSVNRQADGQMNTTGNYNNNTAGGGANAKWSVLAIVGFVLSLTGGSIISLVLSIIGNKECKEKGYQGKGLAVAGIVISVLWLILMVIAIIAMVVLINMYGPEFFEEFFYNLGYY